MNQILITKDEKGRSTLGLKPIIIFFAAALIIVGLIFLGQGVYKSYKKAQENKDYPRPTLALEKNGSSLNMYFKGEIPINKIEYAWNDGSISLLEVSGKKEVKFDVEMPNGNNNLQVYVIDVNGNKTKFEQKVSFTQTDNKDTEKPKIAITKSETAGKIKIKATDNDEIDYVSYKWEGEDEIVVKATEETKKEIVQEINVQKGTKKIVATVVDKTGNKKSITMDIVGSNGPTIKVSIADNNFVVKVTSEASLTKITYTHNDEEKTVENIPEKSKEFEFKVPLKDGVNYLKINAYENDIMTEYKCKKTK